MCHSEFTPLERQMRSRIFWVLRKIDVYVSTMLGLPDSIADDHIDQELPSKSMTDAYSKTGSFLSRTDDWLR
jgi:hypothetical protein